MHLDFYFHYASPYSYFSSLEVETLGVEVVYHPFGILQVMKMVGNTPSPACPNKAKYGAADTARWARRHGYRLQANQALWAAFRQGFTGDVLIQGALAAQDLGVFKPYNRAVFDAIWAEPRDVVTAEGRTALLKDAGIEPAPLWGLAEAPGMAERLDEINKAAAERGLFGVPSFFLGDEMFFGNDRKDVIRERIGELRSAA